MSDPQILLAGQASIWAQPDGPNTKPLYLGCHQMGDIELPGGDLTRLYCPDPSATGKYKVSGSFQGEPEVPTFSIDTPIGKTRDYLERWLCQGNILVNKLTTGRRDLFANFDRAFAFTKAARTGRTMTDAEYYAFVKGSGEIAYNQLERLRATGTLARYKAETRAKVIAEYFEAARKQWRSRNGW